MPSNDINFSIFYKLPVCNSTIFEKLRHDCELSYCFLPIIVPYIDVFIFDDTYRISNGISFTS